MSGRRKFSELTSKFTEADRRIIEEIKAELRAGLPPHPGNARPAPGSSAPAASDNAAPD